jgi:hypothetical protein
MENSKTVKDSAHLLDDLESIRQLLGDESMQPPLLTHTVASEGQIPLLFDVVNGNAAAPADTTDVSTPEPDAQAATQPQGNQPPNPDDLLHLDSELRAAARLIMQDVIDDFAPHIENEIKRRLDARLERLLSQYPA